MPRKKVSKKIKSTKKNSSSSKKVVKKNKAVRKQVKKSKVNKKKIVNIPVDAKESLNQLKKDFKSKKNFKSSVRIKKLPSLVTKKRPEGVKYITWLMYLGGGFSLLLALLLFFGVSFIAEVLQESYPFVSSDESSLLGVLGVFFILVALVYYLLGRGLSHGKNWARLLLIIFSLFGILGALISILSSPFSSLFNLVIDGIIIWYLGFNVNSKKFFN